ncbi:hypothetical protein ACM66B_001609 [Microbotryomycetes sp. NB124-2]
MSDLFRDSVLGQVINAISNGRLLPYEDQKPGFVVPSRYYSTAATDFETASTLVEPPLTSQNGATAKHAKDKGAGGSHAYVIEFEPGDSDNPQNWSSTKKGFVLFLISFLNFSVYIGASVYTSAIASLMEHFQVSLVVATLGLSLFVLGYGFGPMLLAPMQEMHSVGRNVPYIVGLFLFVIFQIPIVLAPNMPVLLVFRALSGFVGSPALATGGGSMADVFSSRALPSAIAIWALGGVLGPCFGPVVGGFAAQAKGWRWPNLELLWLSGFAFIVLFCLLPETYEPTILYRRAQRLRKLTGNHFLKSRAELETQAGDTFLTAVGGRVKKACVLSLEPAIMFSNIYMGLVYSILYLWFEAFPLVFEQIHHFSLGLAGLPFVSFTITGTLSYFFYVWYQARYIQPKAEAGTLQPEERLRLSLYASSFIPVSLFIFGWTSRENIHWIVPVIAASLYLPGIFLLFQSLAMFIVCGYQKLASSALASNALARASFGAAFPLFGRAFYDNLGLGPACSLLGGLSVLMIVPLYLLYRYGDRVRARSKWVE